MRCRKVLVPVSAPSFRSDEANVRPLVAAETEAGEQPPDSAEVASAPADAPTATKKSVIELREGGRSYAAIARLLSLPSAVHAQASFARALRKSPESERAALLQRELGRLDELEKKIRATSEDDPARASQRLVALGKLRTALK